MDKIKPIEYDADMDRFYIPVNSRYEIQTKGKGSSFRLANTITNKRHLVACEYVQEMLEDMAKGCHAETSQLQAKLSQAEAEKVELERDRDEWKEATISANQRFKIAEDRLFELNESVSALVKDIKNLPRYSFLSPSEGGVRRFKDKSGAWIEYHEVIKLLGDDA
jgi:hypothetical protein